jgi:hypothetical protein
LILHLISRQEVQKFHNASNEVCIGYSPVRDDNPGVILLFGEGVSVKSFEIASVMSQNGTVMGSSE